MSAPSRHPQKTTSFIGAKRPPEGRTEREHESLSAPSDANLLNVSGIVREVLSRSTFDPKPLERLTSLPEWEAVLELANTWRVADGKEDDLRNAVFFLEIAVKSYKQSLENYQQSLENYELKRKLALKDSDAVDDAVKVVDSPDFGEQLGALMKGMEMVFPFVFRDLSTNAFLRELAFRQSKGRHFGSCGFLKTLSTRSVKSTLITTNLMSELRDSNTDVTHLIGGASGSGKTTTGVGLAADDCCFPVLMAVGDMMEHKEEWKEIPSKDENAAQKKTRNEAVQALLVSMVTSILSDKHCVSGVTTSALLQLQAYTDDKKPIVVPIFADEMGDVPWVVRALAALNGSDVHKALKLGSGVKVILVAAGTGVGEKGVRWGSESSSCMIHIMGDSSTNEQIFNACFESPCKGLINVEPLKAIVASNARMAAICGNMMKETTRDFNPSSAEKGFPSLASSFDVRSILVRASLRFKSLNGLEKLSESQMPRVMVSALRMHLFPFCATEFAHHIEVKYGLVTDRGIVSKTGEAEQGLPVSFEGGDPSVTVMAPAEGRYALPYFTMPMTAALCNMPWVTQGSLDGGSLEEYWLSVSALAACAASDAPLFSLMLESGTLATLGRCRTADAMKLLEDNNVPGVDELTVVDDAMLPQKQFVLLVSDLQAEGVSCSYNVNDFSYYTKFAKEVDARIASAFVRALAKNDNEAPPPLLAAEGVSALAKNDNEAPPPLLAAEGVSALAKNDNEAPPPLLAAEGVSAIASLRSPSRFPFADTILFLNDGLYLFQQKYTQENEKADGMKQWNDGSLTAELFKMAKPGVTMPDVAACDKKALKALACQKMVECLKASWEKATGYTITSVEYCFVSPKGHGLEHVTSDLKESCRFLDTNRITFMRFNPTLTRKSPLTLTSLPKK